jgi:hypothetical protein
MKHTTPYKVYENGPKGKDLSVFVRFGGVNLKPQKGHSTKSDTFHGPPAARGFYAFPKVAQELFLVGSMDVFQPGTMPKNPLPYPGDDASKEVMDKFDKDVEAFDHDAHSERRRRHALRSMRKEFTKTSGNIWSHLGDYVKRAEIIEERGPWVKTTIKEWQRAFNKMSLKHRLPSDDIFGNKGNINKARGITGYYSKDHCEVFFDEKV